MLQGLPLLSTAEQLEEVSSFLSQGGPAADVPPLVKARCAILYTMPSPVGRVHAEGFGSCGLAFARKDLCERGAMQVYVVV